jgi:hypothetical protein
MVNIAIPGKRPFSLSVCFSVSDCEALAGSVRLTSSSGRSDEGKTPCINVVPYTDSPSAASAIPGWRAGGAAPFAEVVHIPAPFGPGLRHDV